MCIIYFTVSYLYGILYSKISCLNWIIAHFDNILQTCDKPADYYSPAIYQNMFAFKTFVNFFVNI